MANGDDSAGDRWARTVMDEIQRFQALRPRPGRVLRYTPMPPEVRARVNQSLACWPLPQIDRDEVVLRFSRRLSGVEGPPQRPYGFLPEPEASRVAAAAEAEGFAAASAYAAGKSLVTDEEKADVTRKYVREVWASAYRYEAAAAQHVDSVAQAAGNSRSGLAAQLPSASAPPAPAAPGLPGPAGSTRSRRRRRPM